MVGSWALRFGSSARVLQQFLLFLGSRVVSFRLRTRGVAMAGVIMGHETQVVHDLSRFRFRVAQRSEISRHARLYLIPLRVLRLLEAQP